jgi:hypothetical protein
VIFLINTDVDACNSQAIKNWTMYRASQFPYSWELMPSAPIREDTPLLPAMNLLFESELKLCSFHNHMNGEQQELVEAY